MKVGNRRISTVRVSARRSATIEPNTVVNGALAGRYIARAPHLSKARKHEIDRIRAEDAKHQHCRTGGVYQEPSVVSPPSGRAENLGHDAEEQIEQNPPEITFPPDNLHHSCQINIIVKEQKPAKPYRNDKRNAIFQQCAKKISFLLTASDSQNQEV